MRVPKGISAPVIALQNRWRTIAIFRINNAGTVLDVDHFSWLRRLASKDRFGCHAKNGFASLDQSGEVDEIEE